MASLPANGARQARPWKDYLLRNEEWLRPALLACHAIRSKPLSGLASPSEVVAKVAVSFDEETLERAGRPLQVADTMVRSTEGTQAQHILELLWSEEGQALCDHHFRRHPKGYRLESNDIREALRVLYRAPAQPRASLEVQNVGFSARKARKIDHQEVQQAMPEPVKDEAFQNLDRRRQALRSKSNGIEEAVAAKPTGFREPDAYDEQPPDETWTPPPPERRRAQGSTEGEQRVERLTTLEGNSRQESLELIERMQQLRIELGKIQASAEQAEKLLAGLAPKIDEFASWIAEMETVMGRWRTQSRAA
jgi:hypothetical protein